MGRFADPVIDPRGLSATGALPDNANRTMPGTRGQTSVGGHQLPPRHGRAMVQAAAAGHAGLGTYGCPPADGPVPALVRLCAGGERSQLSGGMSRVTIQGAHWLPRWDASGSTVPAARARLTGGNRPLRGRVSRAWIELLRVPKKVRACSIACQEENRDCNNGRSESIGFPRIHPSCTPRVTHAQQCGQGLSAALTRVVSSADRDCQQR
jgi:hypothetical protein